MAASSSSRPSSSSLRWPDPTQSDHWPACVLDHNSSLSLDTITSSFSAPITEEHAFAIIYECMKTLGDVIVQRSGSQGGRIKLVSSTADIFLHREGRVHEATYLGRGHADHDVLAGSKKAEPGGSKGGKTTTSAQRKNDKTGTDNRPSTHSEDKVISELGLVIYSALDFGLKEHEQRSLTPGMEELLTHMTSLAVASTDSSNDEDESDDLVSSSKPTATTTPTGNSPSTSSTPSSSSVSRHQQQQEQQQNERRQRRQRRRQSQGDTDDEGIEKDHDYDDENEMSSLSSSSSSRQFAPATVHSVKTVLSLCANHLSVQSEADAHFRAVCRALVSEAIELSSFLEKTVLNEGSQHSQELQELALQDWAHLWIQTMHQLRQGVKLKKTSYTKTPIEYELTPYEILMDDIRSRRYKLNKVMVDGDIPPKVKKDAHDIILDFIRSRPPLKPAGRRTLPPARRYSTPQELLMADIRSGSAKHSLKKTPRPTQQRKSMSTLHAYKSTSNLQDISIEEETDGSKQGPAQTHHHHHYHHHPSLPKITHSTSLMSLTSIPSTPTSASATTTKKVIKPDPSFTHFDPEQEHEEEDDDGVFSPPPVNVVQATPPKDDDVATPTCVGVVTPVVMRRSKSSRWSLTSGRSSTKRVQWSDAKSEVGEASTVSSEAEARSQRKATEIIQSEQWASALQTLDLTLEEVVHIRNVLTKAEMESLTLDASLREDLEKAKVCFLCMKTRFGIFSWSYQCQLCKHAVCSGCLTKMRIPAEQFSKIPVYALSPSSPQPTQASGADDQQADESDSSSKLFSSLRRGRASSATPSTSRQRNHSLGRHATSSGEVTRRSRLTVSSISCHLDQISQMSEEEDEEVEGEDEGEAKQQMTLIRRSSFALFGLSGSKKEASSSTINSTGVGRTSRLRRASTVSHKHKPESVAKQFASSSSSSPTAQQQQQVNVCIDCKEMILQIIRAQRATRRQQFTQSLCLS